MLDVFTRMKSLSMLKTINPINYNFAKEDWIAQFQSGSFTNPVFIYGRIKREQIEQARSVNQGLIDELDRQVDMLDAKDLFLNRLSRKALEKQMLIADVAESVLEGDDEKTGILMRDYYGISTRELNDLAEAMAFEGAGIENPYLDNTSLVLSPEKVERFSRQNIEATELKSMFEFVIDSYQLTNEWEVIIDDSHSAITVDAASDEGHVIFIPSRHKNVSLLKAVQLAGHEIETHVRHNANCIQLFEDVFGLSEMAATRLESCALESLYVEGLAKISDAILAKKCGDTSGEPHPWYVIAADHAARGESFAEIAKMMYDNGKTLDFCFSVIARVFRGCVYTKNPYAFSRQADRKYLEGYVESIKHYTEPAVFHFARFDMETMQMFEDATGVALDSVQPRFKHQNTMGYYIQWLNERP